MNMRNTRTVEGVVWFWHQVKALRKWLANWGPKSIHHCQEKSLLIFLGTELMQAKIKNNNPASHRITIQNNSSLDRSLKWKLGHWPWNSRTLKTEMGPLWWHWINLRMLTSQNSLCIPCGSSTLPPQHEATLLDWTPCHKHTWNLARDADSPPVLSSSSPHYL